MNGSESINYEDGEPTIDEVKMATSKKVIKVFSIATICVLTLASGVASAADINVPDDYSAIQQAVNAAVPGSTIIVRDGTYTENVNVDADNLTNQSENGSDNCVVQAANLNNHVFNVTDLSTNIWNSISPMTYSDNGTTYTSYLGNCWDDYSDVAADNNEIWDNPYSIDGDTDWYPLKEPFENYIYSSPK